ncbi:hypothetical protein TSO352_21810 [Azospirillum sp. TSO35-2]|nr:hypothetical protein TSO352_21810 [Azospirillum sp. TSO35-2]
MYRYSAARMPYALKAAGFRVFAVCPKNALLQFSDFLDGGRVFAETPNVDDLITVIASTAIECRPDIIIACDGRADDTLALAAQRVNGGGGEDAAWVRRIIGRWYGGGGPRESLRSLCVEMVASAGIRTPRQMAIDDRTSAADLAPLGTPLIVKRDNSSAGCGVAKAESAQDAIARMADLRIAGPRTEGDGDGTAGHARIVAQEFVSGPSASVSFSALDGRMLEAFPYRVLHHQPEPFGPSSAIEIGNHPALLDMAQRVVALLGFSGFGGIDAILPDDGSAPVFLEVNTRPTQTTHLGSLIGADLCRAMACALTGQPYQSDFDPTRRLSMALFPGEWIRDRNSPYLTRFYHDVPWQERRMTAAILSITPQLHPG